MAHRKVQAYLLATCVFVFGCSSNPKIGETPGNPAPRLTLEDAETGRLAWENIPSFGPVPEELQLRGDTTCSALDNENSQFKAQGFHPHAENVDGTPFPDGGFFCIEK